MSRTYRDSGFHPRHSRHPFVPRLKRPVKTWDPEKLYEGVKKILLTKRERRDNEPKRGYITSLENHILMRENLEDEFKASTSDIIKVLMRLNREGLLMHKSRFFAHDSSRDPMFGFKGWSGWSANVYYIT